MAASSSQSVSASSSLKWQIALAVGVPVAVGIGYWYLKGQNAVGDEPNCKSTKARKKPGTSSREISIDCDVPAKVSPEPSKRTPLQEAMALKEEGNQCFKTGKYDAAIQCYQRAIDVCPKTEVANLATFYQNKAAAHEQLQNYEAVKDDCSKALELNPKYVKALMRRAKACEHTNSLVQGLEDITTACILDNFQSQSILVTADRMLKELGRFHAKEAIAKRKPVMPSTFFVKTFFSSFTNDPITQFLGRTDLDCSRGYLKAVDCFQKEDYESMISACTEEINLTEAEAMYKNEALVLRATMYQLIGEHQKALLDLHTVIDTDEVNARLCVNALIKRASIHMQLEDPASCMEDFNKAVRLDPDNSDIYHHRGQVNLLIEKLKEAADDFNLAVMLNPKYPITAVQKCYTDYRCAVTMRDMTKMQEVMQTFEDILRDFSQCAECYTLYAQVLSDQQEFQRADELYQQAIKIDPKNATLHVHRAMLKMQWTGDVEAAVKLITEALALDSKCEIGYETLGTIEVQRGNLKKAIEMFDKAIPLSRTELEMSHLYALKDAAVAQQKVFERMNIQVPRDIFPS